MSIRRKLLVALLSALLVTGLGASGATWFAVRKEANDLFDYHLEQMALSLRDQPLSLAGGWELFPQFGHDFAIQVWDPGGMLVYLSGAGVVLPKSRAGYATVTVDGQDWRVFTLADASRSIQVAAPITVRSGRATAMALRILVPVLATIPLYGLLIWLIVGDGLRPLVQIAGAIRRRAPSSLDPLPSRGLPEEVAPMVSELNALLGRLREAIERQKRFTADAAHELRSPLTALQVQLDTLARARSAEESRAALESLRAGMRRAARLVEQMLTIARLDPEAASEPFGEVELGALASGVAAELEPLAEAKKLELRLERMDAVRLRGQPQALYTLVRNLVDNAIRYTPPSGRVLVQVRAEDDGVVLQVDDTGPGIPAEERTRVFDRFHRLPGSNAEGSGLGLAIVRQVARAHGADVSLGESYGARGLRVTVRFRDVAA
ncbi:MAG TPA: ATP-binding protein [Burkholderiales bacterium]